MKWNAGICLLAAVVPAFAQFTTIATPDAGYTGGTTVVTIVPANFTDVPSITAGGQTLTFSPTPSARTVITGGGWSSWGIPPNTESSGPRVLFFDQTTATITLSEPKNTFGFELEPNTFSPPTHVVTVTFLNGASTLGSITRTVASSSGALLFAATSSTPITSVAISAPTSGGFAVARLRYTTTSVATIPTVRTTGMVGLATLLLAAGALLARKQQLA
jgi:hypothetical protein